MNSGSLLPRAWMRLPSGAHLDLIDPDPGAWTDTDLAVRLSRTARWGGESAWPLPLSVAQHSLLVLELRRAAAPKPLSAGEELQEILHDAEEGFLGFDCISPLKAVLGEPFRAVADRLMQAVAQRYGLSDWTPEGHRLHKAADLAAAASEAVHCVGWTHEEVRDILRIDAPVMGIDPLAARYGDTPWEPWPLDVAAERFHAALQDALARRNAQRAGAC
ncbi:phosphohydrolase [Paracidovorax oryzae]|uniref:phosphohydrolase n=1 Tax=Paracidovorax oryzae TaxID=862720 RepID=UPI0035D0F051